MVNQQLLDYIKQQLQRGINQEQIKSLLIANGWREADIAEAFNLISNSTSSSQFPVTSQPTITALPDAITILGQAWSLYKQRLRTFLGVIIIPVLVIFGVVAVVAGSTLLGFTNFLASGIGRLIIAIIFFLIGFISQVWSQTALLYAIKDSQERIGVVEAYRRGWHKILSLCWVSLLVGFIVMGGFLLLIVPGIIFAIWFSMTMFVLITEDLKGMNALLKSYEYVKGKWGGVFWRFFFINTLSLIIGLIIVLVIEFVFGLKYFGRLVLALSGIFLSPLIWAYSFSLYNNLKASKGEIVFVPTGGQKKAKFIAVVILGVLFIPAILFSIVFLSLSSAREKARDARREADIRQIQIGLKLYYDRYGSYPFSLNELSSYWPAMPVDPKTNLPYQYQRRGDTDYQLCVRFETKTQKCVTSQF